MILRKHAEHISNSKNVVGNSKDVPKSAEDANDEDVSWSFELKGIGMMNTVGSRCCHDGFLIHPSTGFQHRN